MTDRDGSAVFADSNLKTYRLEGKDAWNWWANFFRGESGKVLVVLLCLPFGFALMMYMAGPKAWGLVIPTAIVWLLMAFVGKPLVTRRMQSAASVSLSDDVLEVRSPLFQKRISWSQVKDLMFQSDSKRESTTSERLLILTTNEEILLPVTLDRSGELFSLIENTMPRQMHPFEIKERINPWFEQRGNMAVLAICIAVSFRLVKLFFLKLTAGDSISVPAVQGATDIGIVIIALSLIVGCWMKIRSWLVKTIYADKSRLVIETISSKYELLPGQLKSVKKLGSALSLKTERGWYILVGVKELHCRESLLALLKSWNFDLVEAFPIPSEIAKGRAKALFRAYVTVIVLIIIGVPAYFILNEQWNEQEWHKQGLAKLGRVVIADRTIPAGKVIDLLDVREARVAPFVVPANAIVYSDLVVGKRLNQEVTAADELRVDYLDSVDRERLVADELQRAGSDNSPVTNAFSKTETAVATQSIDARKIISKSEIKQEFRPAANFFVVRAILCETLGKSSACSLPCLSCQSSPTSLHGYLWAIRSSRSSRLEKQAWTDSNEKLLL